MQTYPDDPKSAYGFTMQLSVLDIGQYVAWESGKAEVGSPELLRKLYVLTCADISAVGPGTLNAWRRQLITYLYFHTLELISSGSPEERADLRVRERRQAVAELVQLRPDAAWWRRQVEILPAGILFSTEPARIVSELSRLQELPRRDAIAWGRYVPQRKAVEYAVGTHEEITTGIFYKLTGALSSRGQRILSAEIHTLADGLVLDHFYVEDRDFDGPPPQERIDEVSGALVNALRDGSEKPPEFRRTWQAQQRETTATLNRVPTQVRIDNDTSDRATVIAVFTYDPAARSVRARTVRNVADAVNLPNAGRYSGSGRWRRDGNAETETP